MTSRPIQPPNTPYHRDWYVTRPHEERLALANLEFGKPVLLWGPRRQGRTWLWTHVVDQWLRSADDDRRIAPILFHTLPADAFTSLDPCLRAFAAALVEALDDPNPEATLEAAWSGRGDPKTKLNALVSRTILPRTRGPLLLVLDRADLLVGCPFYNDVSGLLRSWAERFPWGEPWSRLRLLVTVSTHPARLSTEIHQSFFYGLSDPIEVGDLDRAQIADLATRHGVPLPSPDLDRLVDLTGGHPHLVRAVLFDLAGGRYTLPDLARGGPLGPSLAADHLRQHRTRLASSPELAAAFATLGNDPAARVKPDALDALIRQGLVRQGDGGAHPVRYGLYKRLLGADSDAARPDRKKRVFYAYFLKDDALRERLEVHLKLLEREALIEPWHARRIAPGEDWARAIDRHLEEADIVLLLVSADFIASDYCWEVEVKRAMERHEEGNATVLPVVLRPCDWKTAPFAKLQALPRDGIPVTRWTDPEDAWVDVAQGIRRIVCPET